MKKTVLFLIFILTLSMAAFGQDKKLEKLTVEELVKRHLASIGTPEDLAAVKTRFMSGEGSFSSKIKDQGKVTGPAQFASEGNKVVFAAVFDNPTLPYEKAAYDGKDITVGLPNGINTWLARFLKTQEVILKDGLFGGTLSSAWPLLDPASKKAKIEATTAKLDGKQVYKIKYSAKGSDLRITLLFDPETYRHIRSEYEYDVQAQMGRVSTESAGARPDTYSMVEEFGDFKPFEKLTLPASYQITITAQVTSNGNRNTISFLWATTFDRAKFNEPIDAVSFKVS